MLGNYGIKLDSASKIIQDQSVLRKLFWFIFLLFLLYFCRFSLNKLMEFPDPFRFLLIKIEYLLKNFQIDRWRSAWEFEQVSMCGYDNGPHLAVD